MADLEEILQRQLELEATINAQGDTPDSKPGMSLLSGIGRVLNAFPNAESTAAISAVEPFKSEKFFPEDVNTPWERAKFGSNQDLGWSNFIRYVTPEINPMDTMGISKDIQNYDFFKPKDALFNAANFMSNPLGAISEKLGGPDFRTFKNAPQEGGISLKDLEEGGEWATSALAGFAGDVFLDPTTYLTVSGAPAKAAQGVQGITKAAGKFLTEAGMEGFAKAAEKGAAKTLANYFTDKSAREAFELMTKNADGAIRPLSEYSDDALKALEAVRNPQGVEAITELNKGLLTKASMAGEDFAEDQFHTARAFLTAQRKADKLQSLGVPVDATVMRSLEKDARVRDALDLGKEVGIEDLFSKETLRWRGHDIGSAISSGVSKIPGADDAIKYLNGKYYSATTKVADITPELIKDVAKVPAQAMSYTSRKAAKLLSPMSRRITGSGEVLGERTALTQMKEYEKARIFNDTESWGEAEKLFANYSPEQITDAFDMFETSKKSFNLMKVKNPNLDIGTITDMVHRKFAQDKPEAFSLYKYVEGEYVRMEAEAIEAGVPLRHADDYINHEYLNVPNEFDRRTMISGVTKNASKQAGSNNESFTLARHFDLLDEAIAAGYEPVRDLKYLYGNRVAAHNASMANRKFMDNMFVNFGLAPEARSIVANFARQATEADAKNVPNILRQMNETADRLGVELTQADMMKGIGVDPMDVLAKGNLPVTTTGELDGINHIYQNVDGIWGLPRNLQGDPISPSQYQNLKRIAREGNNVGDYSADGKAMLENLHEQIKFNQFKFNPNEEQAINTLWKNYQEGTTKLGLLGRTGEFMKDRAGVARLEGPTKKIIENYHKDLPEASKLFYSGDLPAPIVNMINDAAQTRTIYRQMLEDRKNTTWAPILGKISDGFGTYLNINRFASTKLWPSYWLGNFGGGQLQALQANMSLADNFSPLKLHANSAIFERGADLITEQGQRIANTQLMRELKANQIKVSFKDASEMTKGVSEMLEKAGGFKNPVTGGALGNNETIEAIAKNFEKFGEYIENYGRQNLYVSLRKKGYSARTASEETTRTFVDYVGGKTNFEKSVFGSLYFFYAFARGNATNTATALLTRPGALSAQGSYRRMMTNLLQDEGAFAPESFEENVSSLKGSEGWPAYIGTDPASGNPKVINSFRTPMEESNRMTPVRLPSDLSAKGLWDALKGNVKDIGRAQLASLRPDIKGAIEGISGRNMYFDKPLDDPYLNQIIKPEALIAALNGEGPQADPTRFDSSGLMKFSNLFLPPVTMANSRAKRFATSENQATGLLEFLTGVRTNVVDPEKSGAYDKLNRYSQQILQDYGVETGNKKIETILRDIEASKAGLDPKKINREEKLQREQERAQRKRIRQRKRNAD